MNTQAAFTLHWPASGAAARTPDRVVGRAQLTQRPWLLIFRSALPLWVGVGVTRLATFMLTEDRIPGVFYVAIRARLFHLLGILLVALLCYRLALAVPWRSGRRVRAVLAHAMLAFAVGFVSRPMLIAAAAWLDPVFTLADDWHTHFQGQGIRYWLISGLGFVSSYVFGLVVMLGLRAAVELRDAELDKARLHNDWMQSKLQILRMQMNPHFVCNALNTIASAISVDPQRASALVVKFGDLFRRSLALSDEDWVEIGQELDFAEAYLQLEVARFGSRLMFSIDLDAGAASQWVPTMLLQPMIENAVRHGVNDDRDQLQVRIVAAAVQDSILGQCLRVEISNRSSGVLAAGAGQARIGLGNTQSRLQAIYGAAARLELQRPDERTFNAVLYLPLAKQRRATLT